MHWLLSLLIDQRSHLYWSMHDLFMYISWINDFWFLISMMIYHFPKRVHIMLLTFSILFMYINRLIYVHEWLLWSITSTLVTIKHWVVFCYFCFHKNMHTYLNWICWYMNTFYVFALSSTVRYFSSNAFVQIGTFDLSCSTGLIMTFSKDFVSYEISLHVCGYFMEFQNEFSIKIHLELMHV